MLRTAKKSPVYNGCVNLGSCFFVEKKMTNDIKETIKEFEKKNNIRIENYYYKKRPQDHFAVKDSYIGEDIFESHINEWLEIGINEGDRGYLLDLLKNYLYFPESRFNEEVEKIVDLLEKDGVSIKDTLFVTFPSKKGVASGGDNISAALILSIMYFGQKENIITDVERDSVELENRIGTYKSIVFMDDIIGSGKTLNTNVSNFFNRFSFAEDVIFYVCALCGREKRINSKIKQFIKRYNRLFKSLVLHPAEKSLTGSSNCDKLRQESILRIEKEIENNATEDRDKTFIMGFEGNQLLVSFYYNTPNNTLSLFWRPSTISVPLFLRTSYRRPDISECRANKEKLKKNAYERGKMKKNDINDTDDNPFLH